MDRTRLRKPATAQTQTLAVIASDMTKYLTTFLLILSSPVLGQSKLDIDCFVMGLIDDGTKKMIKEEKLDWEWIEEFSPLYFELMDCIDSLIKIENSTRISGTQITSSRTLSPNNGISNMYYSRALADQINKNYKFKFHHEWDLKMRKMYIGHVKPKCLKTNEERISFILGAFIHFGKQDKDLYLYSIRLSPDKFDLILKSLKKLKCEIVTTVDEMWMSDGTTKSDIESRTIVFKPTVELKNRITEFNGLIDRIEKKRVVYFNTSE